MNKPINWFEIPVADLDRAVRFYETLFGIGMQRGDFGPSSLAVFPYDEEKATGGCLIAGEGMNPSADGAVVYLNAGADFDAVLARVATLGGKVVVPRTDMAGIPPFAHFLDSEGNRVGLAGSKL
jgi:predicted enzyme related to lactoylglutathione lyase